jgi:hypothetical protein
LEAKQDWAWSAFAWEKDSLRPVLRICKDTVFFLSGEYGFQDATLEEERHALSCLHLDFELASLLAQTE